jgi:ankyrin repeat protein
MKVLIAKGANVNAANDAGMTPLHYAAQRGSERIIEFLAAQGARFDVKNKQGRSPSELARGKTAALMNKLAAGNATTQQ